MATRESSLTFELIDAPSPDALLNEPHHFPWWIVIVASLVILSILATIFILRKRKPRTLSINATAYADALASLNAIELLDPRQVATECSLILRKYLSTTANDPALFETHEEFITRHNALASLNDAAKSSATTTFSKLAQLKYTNDSPAISAADILTESRALLENLHQGFSA